jgi:hypothetical protein
MPSLLSDTTLRPQVMNADARYQTLTPDNQMKAILAGRAGAFSVGLS